MSKICLLLLALLALLAMTVADPGPGICTCGKGRYAVASCDSDECYNYCDKMHSGHGVCISTGKNAKNALATALSPASNAAAAAISCDKCIAKLADDIPADDAAFICQKVLKCKQAMPTDAPQPTTVVPQPAQSGMIAAAATAGVAATGTCQCQCDGFDSGLFAVAQCGCDCANRFPKQCAKAKNINSNCNIN